MFIFLALLIQKKEEIIVSREKEYYVKLGLKLNNPRTQSKTNWSLLKTLVNGRRVSLVPPIQHNDKLKTNLKEKAKVFNGYFAKQCNAVENKSQIPVRANFYISQKLNNIKFVDASILKTLKNLFVIMANGHDNLSFIKVSNYVMTQFVNHLN